jgi:hypothetical protein
MFVCRRPGGPGPFKHDGSFDLTVCFEDAISSVLFALLLASAIVRTYLLCRTKKLERSRKSLTLLWLKEVRIRECKLL